MVFAYLFVQFGVLAVVFAKYSRYHGLRAPEARAFEANGPSVSEGRERSPEGASYLCYITRRGELCLVSAEGASKLVPKALASAEGASVRSERPERQRGS